MTYRLQSLVKEARLRPITPRREPPSWCDFAQITVAQGFHKKHAATIQQVLGTSSLAATFAGRDITPILMQTGRLPSDFNRRLQETETMVNAILASAPRRDQFLKDNYARAVVLGELHQQVAESARGALRWNPKERLPMNQQSFLLVLATFAWWPVEALIARRVVNPDTDKSELDAWFHYWSVLGYGMGAWDALLPRSYADAKEQVGALRLAQYARPGEPLPDGIPVLLGGQVRYLAMRFAGKPLDKPALDKLAPLASQVLFSMIRLSPGLPEALGLEKDGVGQLTRLAKG